MKMKRFATSVGSENFTYDKASHTSHIKIDWIVRRRNLKSECCRFRMKQGRSSYYKSKLRSVSLTFLKNNENACSRDTRICDTCPAS